MTPNRHTMLARASSMRRDPTEAERRLWQRIRNSQLDGHKFRRQAVIGSHVADFFCPTKGLVVEIDSDTHDMHRDANRDERLSKENGFATTRFSNREVVENMEGVLETLRARLASLPNRWNQDTTPNPSSEEEGR